MLGRLSDEELARLGVTTIGDRVLLKERIREVRNLNVDSLRTLFQNLKCYMVEMIDPVPMDIKLLSVFLRDF